MPTFSETQTALRNGSRKGRKLTAAEQKVANFDEPLNNAQEMVSQQKNDVKRSQRLNQLEKLTTADAKSRTPYAMDARDNSLETAALQASGSSALFNNAAKTPEQAALAQGGSGMQAALSAARQLHGAGTFLPGAAGAAGEYGGDLNMLRQTAMGQGPSAAQAMALASQDANARAMRSAAAGGRGGVSAAGLRTAISAGNQASQQSIQQLAALRANEQLTAQAALPGAQAQRIAALTGAANAETSRQNAGGTIGLGAAQAASDLGRTAIAGQSVRNDAIQAGGQLAAQGVQTAVGARGVQAGVARDAAADLEEQKRRALIAQQQLAQTMGARDQLRTQRIVARIGAEPNPTAIAGGVLNAAGAGIAMATR